MEVQVIGMALGEPGVSQAISTSITSAQTTALTSDSAVVTSTAACFVRWGSNPTALANGTDAYLAANTPYRLSFPRGSKLAFILASGTGTVYVTPGA